MAEMAEMHHPDVGTHDLETDLKSVFCEEMWDLMVSHSHDMSYYCSKNDRNIHVIATDRFDVELADGQIMTVRLRMMETAASNVSSMTHGDCTLDIDTKARGLILEYATFAPDELEEYEIKLDNALSWVPYIFVGVHQEEDYRVVTTMLNARDGTELSLDDQISGLRVLRGLRSHLAADRLLNIQIDDDYTLGEANTDISLGLPDKFSGPFYPDEFIEGYACQICEDGFVYCSHQAPRQN